MYTDYYITPVLNRPDEALPPWTIEELKWTPKGCFNVKRTCTGTLYNHEKYVWPDGVCTWRKNGQLHREDGPAVVNTKVLNSETNRYFLFGREFNTVDLYTASLQTLQMERNGDTFEWIPWKMGDDTPALNSFDIVYTKRVNEDGKEAFYGPIYHINRNWRPNTDDKIDTLCNGPVVAYRVHKIG